MLCHAGSCKYIYPCIILWLYNIYYYLIFKKKVTTHKCIFGGDLDQAFVHEDSWLHTLLWDQHGMTSAARLLRDIVVAPGALKPAGGGGGGAEGPPTGGGGGGSADRTTTAWATPPPGLKSDTVYWRTKEWSTWGDEVWISSSSQGCANEQCCQIGSDFPPIRQPWNQAQSGNTGCNQRLWCNPSSFSVF